MLKIVNLFKKHHNELLKKSENSFFDLGLLTKNYSNFSIEYINFEDVNSESIIDKMYDFCSENLNYIILLKDERITVNEELYKSLFICNVDLSGPNIQNSYISSQIAKRIKQFNIVKASFSTADEIELMRLPFRSFTSEILERLRTTMIRLDLTNFNNDFESCIREIRSTHRKPMKRPQTKKRYFVDDKKLHFELGKELHARHETGSPHTKLCDLNARYRFGCVIDPVRHYNVCNENSASNLLNLDLFDCHKALKRVTNSTHVNIFSNDHIA